MIRNLYPDGPDPAEAQQNCNRLKKSKTQVNQLQTEPDPKNLHKNIRRPHTKERWPQKFSPI